MRCRDALATTLAVAVTVAGCRVAQDWVGGEERLRFDHRAHLARTPDCASCHPGESETPRAGHAACVACHEIPAEPDARCTSCHADPAYRPAPPPETDLRFAHRLHVERHVACDRCHGDVAASTRLDRAAHRPTMERCLECHRSLGPEAIACATCHTRTTAGTRPASHDGRWLAEHGPHAVADDARCDACHPAAQCLRCHQETPPRDHGEFFLRRGHGLASYWDRERCLACHREDACTECHRVTPPANHRTGWGAPTFRHCQQCHLPLEDTSCAVCHERAHPAGVPFR